MAKKGSIIALPGAGTGFGKMLAEEITSRDGAVKLVADAYIDALKATKRFWSKDKDGWEDVPDFRARLDAADSLWANIEGEPIKRVLSMTQDVPTPDQEEQDAIAKIAQSPALQAALQRQLDAARAAGAQIVPITATPVSVENLDE